jgi:hypothetical protein
VRACFNAFSAEYTFFFGKMQFPFTVQRKYFTWTDADTRPAVNAFTLIYTDTAFKDPHVRAQADHGITDNPALIIGHIYECFTLR